MPTRLPTMRYPGHFLTRRINRNGQFRWRGQLCFLSSTLIHQVVGLDFTDDGLWNVCFGPTVLAQIDEQGRLVRAAAPARTRRRAAQ